MAFKLRTSPLRAFADNKLKKTYKRIRRKDPEFQLTESETNKAGVGKWDVKKAKKEHRDLKKKVRKGEYEPKQTSGTIGKYKFTWEVGPEQALEESRRNLGVKKIQKIRMDQMLKKQKKDKGDWKSEWLS